MEDPPQFEDSKLISDPTVRLDRYRWFIITIFAVYCGTNFFLFMQFTIIADLTERFYGIDSVLADCTGLVFMISYLIFFIPVGHYIENHNLKSTALVSTSLTAVGNLLKLFAAVPGRFYLILISQGLCGVGQVFMISLPPKVASIWFGAEEVSLACAIGVMGCQIGLALGVVTPSLLVPNTNIEAMSQGFFKLFVLDNVASISVFLVVLLFFRSKPDSPPSHSQAAFYLEENGDKMSYLQAFKGFMKNRDYLLILTTFGLSYGIWNSLGILVNELYLHFFPDHEKDLGVLVLLAIVAGGVFGTIIFGYILDKTHEFKKVSSLVLSLNCISWTMLMVAFTFRSMTASSILIPICGFFSGSIMVIAFEYAVEATYPISESYGTSLLNATIYAFGIFYVLLLELIFKTVGVFPGQVIIIASLSVSTAVSSLISSDFKRMNANLLDSHISTYGSTLKEVN